MLNFIIVDDNKSQRKRNSNIVINNMMKNKIELNIVEIEDYNDKLIDIISNNSLDKVYILDIELPSLDGVEIARKIRYKYNDWNSPIIILTVHTSLYYEVYKQRLQILDFIPKFGSIDTSINEDIDICLRMLNKEKVYKYIYKNVEYNIKLSDINFIQRDGRKTKIVTKNQTYYQNITINAIKSMLPTYFKISAKGTLINMRNIHEIDWNEMIVFFKYGTKDYVVTNSHKKEIENYEAD